MKSVCVFTGSSPGNHPAYQQAALNLGREIAQRKVTLVYGGAIVGLMGTVADAALKHGGRVLGVLPEALADLEIAHSGLSELKIVDSMHTRKMTMAESADAFIALPGGLGTLEEIFEVWTWTQLGVHKKPLGFVNTEGYYNSLFTFLDQATQAGFIKKHHRNLAIANADPSQLLDLLSNAKIEYKSKLPDGLSP